MGPRYQRGWGRVDEGLADPPAGSAGNRPGLRFLRWVHHDLGGHAAIRALPQPASTPAIETDRSRREGTNVAELTGLAASADQVIGLWLVDPEAGRERSDMM